LKAYVITAGVVFGLLTLAHIWRIIVEPNLASDPWFILTTLASGALCLGAWYVARRGSERRTR
jgi:hypothetical protein